MNVSCHFSLTRQPLPDSLRIIREATSQSYPFYESIPPFTSVNSVLTILFIIKYCPQQVLVITTPDGFSDGRVDSY